MRENKSYIGIDYFRFIAALLVIAIHTSPLETFSETGDFILTRIVGRVAVPFFLMTSGFFLISKYTYNARKLVEFVKKTSVIYGISILIYIPINVYNDYFKMDYLLPNIIKDIVFDGTLYHLWYLPASIIGGAIAWYLVKKLFYPKALVVASILYLIGLFGDSYYGMAKEISCLNSFYELIFQVSDYMRNGIFFTPIFLILGGLIADNYKRISLKKSIIGFGISFALMGLEAMIVHNFDMARHDSMYIFLVPSMYFLFNVILYFRGKRHEGLRTSSLIIYIIHPMMIVIVRVFAKFFHMQNLLIENSIIHYLMVCMASVVFAVVSTVIVSKFKQKQAKNIKGIDRGYIEIDLNNLEHNVKVLQKVVPPRCELMAVVKAKAYGHGAYEMTTHMSKLGIKAFAVATIEEGIELRRYGISGEILILGYTEPTRAKELHKYDLIQALIDYEYALLLNKQGYDIKSHIKIDTGMHRLGFDVKDSEIVSCVLAMKHIRVCGIYTHLCTADSLEEKDVEFTNMQIKRFYNLLNSLEQKGITLPKIHIQSSYGLLNYPELKCDYVRLGIALYGVLSTPDYKTKLQLDLRPVLSLKSTVALLRIIRKGDSVGYGRAFVADRDTVIAIIPIGYGDGLPRNLSCGKSYVLINGHKAPIVGRICMDQFAVDVTDIPDIKVGGTVTLIGQDENEEILAPMVAQNSGSITNELLSRMGERLKVIVIKWERY